MWGFHYMSSDFLIGVSRNNPLVRNVFTQDNSNGYFPPAGERVILTEAGLALTTENNIELLTET